MEYLSEDQRKLERAKKKIEKIKGFYKHLAVYIIVNIVLLIVHAINMEPGEDFFTWRTFMTAGFWGLGLFAHWLSVFGRNIFLSPDWEERKIKEFMEREKNKQSKWE